MNIETLRRKQRAMMVELMERKVRSRAQRLYETRGQGEGGDLQDWFQAESEVLDNSVLAPLYRRMKSEAQDADATDPDRSDPELLQQQSCGCENPA